MKQANTDALRSYFLWKDLQESLWVRLEAQLLRKHYRAGESICAADEGNLCILWDGRIKVYACGSGDTHTALLRTLEAGALFGVNGIYGSAEAPMSRLVAARACEVICVPITLWEQLLAQDVPTMQAYVRFLTERIEFLNQKIRYLTAGSSEKKLATYLLTALPADGSFAPLPLPVANLADLLNLGRASLYRAINRLTQDGFLLRQDKSYALLHREQLPNHYS